MNKSKRHAYNRIIYILLFAALLILCGCTAKKKTAEIDAAAKAELIRYVEEHHQTPEEYIIGKFDEHDVVFIGEYHRIKENVELIQRLIPQLYKNGIYTLCTEFGRRKDQALIDSLLNAPAWNEELARLITFKGFVFWGYQEYVDVFKTAWQVNHALPENNRRFRILGVNNAPDWSYIKTKEDRDKGAVMKKVWGGDSEEQWAQVILDEVIAKDEKTLVYCGIHHAFSEYRQPIVSSEGEFIRFGDVRMGNHVYNAIGKRAITVYLHAVWSPAKGYQGSNVFAADGIIDLVMAEIPEQFIPVGFDTRGTPFGKLPGKTSVYKHGYDNFTLADFCDGYIYQMPLTQYRGVTPIEGFINENNIEEARLQSPNPSFRNASIEEFNRSMAKDAEIPRRFKDFKVINK